MSDYGKAPQQPTATLHTDGHLAGDETFNHPAYGTVKMVVRHGGNRTLFGSDLGHNETVCITVSHAELTRHLNRDWIHPLNQIVEFEMSHAQFAQFITSAGNGSGTPITINHIAGDGEVPAIKNIQTKHETFRKEIAAASRERLEAMSAEIEKLGAMIESGKLPKAELREIQKELRRHVGQLPGTMEFVVKSAEEALEKATSDAKIEVESFVQMTAQRIGLSHISELRMLEGKPSGEKHEHASRF